MVPGPIFSENTEGSEIGPSLELGDQTPWRRGGALCQNGEWPTRVGGRLLTAFVQSRDREAAAVGQTLEGVR